jgi:hypothetical protein
MITKIEQYAKALDKLNATGVNLKCSENGTIEVIWTNGNPNNISNEQIDAKVQEVIAEYNGNQFQRDRATAYPSIQEQLDMQYWDKVNGTNNWQDAIAKVKSDNPKP